MGDTFTTIEVRSTLRTLRDYLRDLLEAKFEQFSTKLRLFVNYCEMDNVMRSVAKSLHGRGGDPKAWFTAVAAGGPVEVPKAAAARLGHYYMTLSEMKRQGIEARQFISTVYSGRGGFTEMYAAFRAEFLEPFANELLARMGKIEAALEDDPGAKIDLEATFAEDLAAAEEKAGAPKPAAGGPKAAAASAKAAVEARVEDLVSSLGASVKKAKEIVADARKDIETDLKILKLELSKKQPNKDVVLAVVRPLERLGGQIAEAAGAIAAKASAAGADLAARVVEKAGGKKK